MPYNLWIFPLLSGFYFLIKYKYNTYKYQRLDSQILIFHSILYGIFIFLGVYLIRVILTFLFPTLIPTVYSILYKLPIKEQDLLWTSLFCFSITVIIVESLNYIYEATSIYYKTIAYKDFDRFILPVAKRIFATTISQDLVEVKSLGGGNSGDEIKNKKRFEG